MEKAVNRYLENFLNGSSIVTPSVTAMPCQTFEEGAPDCRQKGYFRLAKVPFCLQSEATGFAGGFDSFDFILHCAFSCC